MPTIPCPILDHESQNTIDNIRSRIQHIHENQRKRPWGRHICAYCAYRRGRQDEKNELADRLRDLIQELENDDDQSVSS